MVAISKKELFPSGCRSLMKVEFPPSPLLTGPSSAPPGPSGVAEVLASTVSLPPSEHVTLKRNL